MEQELVNKKFYESIIKDLKVLSFKSLKLTFEEQVQKFEQIEDRVIWSDWGMHGNLTKKSLMEYLDVINTKFRVKNKNKSFFLIYNFDREVKTAKKKMTQQFKSDFRE